MTIKAYTETTEWKDGNVPNHTYLIDMDHKDKIVGYVKQNESEAIWFEKPLPFWKSRRKFKISKSKWSK